MGGADDVAIVDNVVANATSGEVDTNTAWEEAGTHRKRFRTVSVSSDGTNTKDKLDSLLLSTSIEG